MQVYQCKRCGSKHDFATQAEGRLCDHCGAPLTFHGIEVSPWGEHAMRDYDAKSISYPASLSSAA